MTYPVDDKGNPRVDFVWGNFPLQPDDQRNTYNTENQLTNQNQNNNWTVYPTVGSSTLASGWTTLSFGTGDGGSTRQQTFTWDNHEIATTGWSNYPAFLPNYAGDGDTGLEVIMPNLIGLSNSAASATLAGVGLSADVITSATGATVANNGKVFDQENAAGSAVNAGSSQAYVIYEAPTVPSVVNFDSLANATGFLQDRFLTVGNVTTSTVGATSGNDGWIKSQSIPAGTIVDTGTAIDLVVYDYVVPGVYTTGPIAGFSRNSYGHFSLNGNQSVMFLTGRTVRPTIGDYITVSGSSDSSHNVVWVVGNIANDDSYNTGGTAVLVTLDSGSISQDTSSGGTWTKN